MSEEHRYLKARFPEGTDMEAKRKALDVWLAEHTHRVDYDDVEIDRDDPLVLRYWALCGSSTDWDLLCDGISTQLGAVATGWISEDDIDPFEMIEV